MKHDKRPLEPRALLDYDAAQQYLGGLSRSGVKALAAAGAIRVIRIGRRTMFRRDDLDAFIARQSATAIA
jgi:excisionase family DNA binding protein